MTVRDLASDDSAFFLKSEYGPLSDFWPAVAFTNPQVKTRIDRNYQAGHDFVLYTGTGGAETENPEDRRRLLSLVRLDKTQSRPTQQLVPAASWQWAQDKYPGKWQYAFAVLEGWSLVEKPLASELLSNSYSKLGEFPFRGSVLRIEEAEKQRVLDLRVKRVDLPHRPPLLIAMTRDALLRDSSLNVEATRISDLAFNRVRISGTPQSHTAPLRSAPTNFLLLVAEKLRQIPLLCELCSGEMYLRPVNRLLQPSPDRDESAEGSYGPENFRLVHLACNLAKNDASETQYREWFQTALDAFARGE